MKKNVSGQYIGAQMVSATDGSAFTGSVTVYVTGNAGTQAVGSVGSGACTHEGNGFHTYAPAQAETNYDHIAFTFIGTGAVPATVQVFTSFPQTVDNATDISAILADTNELQADWANGGRLDNILDARASQTSVDTIDGIVDNILIDTAEIGAAGAGLTAVPWNAAWDAEVQSEVQDAIEFNHLDHLLAVTYDPATKPGASDALLNEMVESDAGVARFTANALEQGPSGGGGVADWTADERTAIRSILGIPASGTTPDDPTTGILDTIRDKVDVVDTVADAIKAKTDNLPAAPASTTNITAGTITTVTNLTNAPTNGDLTATMKTSVTTAATAATPTAAAVTANVNADVVKINGSASAASHLAAHAPTAVEVTFTTGGSTTTAVLVNVDGAAASSTDDVYNGRVLVFTAPAGLKDQATNITDYVGSTKTATFPALTTAPDATATAVLV